MLRGGLSEDLRDARSLHRSLKNRGRIPRGCPLTTLRLSLCDRYHCSSRDKLPTRPQCAITPSEPAFFIEVIHTITPSHYSTLSITTATFPCAALRPETGSFAHIDCASPFEPSYILSPLTLSPWPQSSMRMSSASLGKLTHTRRLRGHSANRHSTLVPEEIPAKLRCGLCNLVAVNAVKLPCCETSICDKCMHPRQLDRFSTSLTILKAKQSYPSNAPSASTNRCRPTFAPR